MTDLAAAHYAGGEAYDLDSVEVKILLRTVALILRDDLAGVADEVFLKAANALLPRYGTDGIAARLAKLGTEVFGPVTPGEYFILAIVSPVLYEFAFDSDGVDDNAGELTGYAPETPGGAAANIFEKIRGIAEDILLYLTLISKYLLLPVA